MAKAITVVVPLYNAEVYVENCIEQLLNQGFSEEEMQILLVDDASTDQTLEICETLASHHPCIEVLSSEHNGGAGAARNRGIVLARGEYLYCFDVDDEIAPNALKKLCERCERAGLDALFFSGELVYESPELEQTSPQDPKYFRRSVDLQGIAGRDMFIYQVTHSDYCAQPCLQLARTEFVLQHGVRFAEGIVNEDNLYVILTLLNARRCSMIRDEYYTYHVRQGTVTTDQALGRKRFVSYFVLASMLLDFAFKATQRNDTDLAFALTWLYNYFIDCAFEGLAAIPIDEPLDCPGDTAIDHGIFNSFIRPHRKLFASLESTQRELLHTRAERDELEEQVDALIRRIEDEEEAAKTAKSSPLSRLLHRS